MDHSITPGVVTLKLIYEIYSHLGKVGSLRLHVATDITQFLWQRKELQVLHV